MSAALLRGDLKAELEELDDRYSDKIQNKQKQQSKQKVGGGKVKKRYKQNPKVDRLARDFDSSPATLKKLEKATVQKNTEKLLQLSGNKSGVKKVVFDSIFDQIASSKSVSKNVSENISNQNKLLMISKKRFIAF